MLDFYCSCGKELKMHRVKATGGETGGDIFFNPCQDCLDAAWESGYYDHKADTIADATREKGENDAG